MRLGFDLPADGEQHADDELRPLAAPSNPSHVDVDQESRLPPGNAAADRALIRRRQHLLFLSAIGIVLVFTLATSSYMAALASIYRSSPCEVSLNSFAVASSSIGFIASLILVALLLVVAFRGPEPNFGLRGLFSSRAADEARKPAAQRNMTPVFMLGCGTFVLAAAGLGVLIWGSALLYGENRWQRAAAGTLACPLGLYMPLAIMGIVSWLLLGGLLVALFVAVCCVMPIAFCISLCRNSCPCCMRAGRWQQSLSLMPPARPPQAYTPRKGREW